jgi:hypothetical protein
MSISRPYHRTWRPFLKGICCNADYIFHPRYAESPAHYVRGFLLLLKDMQSLFEYIEPCDENLACYSYRIHELLLRACVEVEANCKAVLHENGYVKKNAGDWTMSDYQRTEKSHKLSAYEVTLPFWHGHKKVCWKPFKAWKHGKTLPWYSAYNSVKHDRHKNFDKASFEHMIDSVCGLQVVLCSQFFTNDFQPSPTLLDVGGPTNGLELGAGQFLSVQFPVNWPKKEQYNFDWNTLKLEPDPFQKYDYSKP